MLNIRIVSILVLVTVLLTPRICPAQFSNDAKWIPGGVNSVVLVSGERIFASELAKNEGWSDVNTGAFDRGTSVLPPKVERMIVASQFDLSYMMPIWSVSILSPEAKVDFNVITAKRNSSVDEVAGRNALVLPNDVYLIQLDDHQFGAMAPADRQQLTRWVESATSRPAILSPYISEALAFADKNSDITIAFDLNSAINVDSARSQFMNFDSVKPADVEKAAKAASRLRGVMLGITLRDKIYAALRVDFSPGTIGIETFSKAAIIESLENCGVMIEEIRDWDFSNESGTLILKGNLSESGLRQLNSLVAQPVQAVFRGIGSEVLDPSKAQSNNPEVATKRYLNRIELCFKDFDVLLRKQNKQVVGSYQRWFSANAEQIDMLPTADVDSEILDFGARVSEGFRDISLILLTAQATTKSQSATLAANRSYDNEYGYGYGYRNRRPNLSQQKKEIKAKSNAQAETEASKIMIQLRNDLGNVRRNFPSGN